MKTIALVGNQNSGKTTLFNYLTGTHQKVGNFPGITIEVKHGKLLNHPEIEIIDLPGIYSLDNYSSEEENAINFLFDKKIDAIIDVIDSTCLERHLLLTNELIKLNKPIFLFMSFIDEFKKEKKEDKFNLLENSSGCKTLLLDYKDKTLNKKIYNLINQEIDIKLQKQINTELFKQKERSNSFDFDKVFLHKYFAYPIMILIFSFILFLAFYLGGSVLGSLINNFIDYLTNILHEYFKNAEINRIMASFLLDGLLPGLGSLISLLPTILILFFCVSILEDSGYLARIAVIMDRILRPLGLSGRSFISLILGYGCTVPAVMSSKILVDKKEQELLIKLVPYSLCPARMMILLAILPLIFGKYVFFVLLGFYLLANLVMVLMSILFRLKNKNKPPLLIIELPKYRRPSLKNAYFLVEEKLKDYINKAFNVILLATIAIWFLSSFDWKMQFIEDKNLSILSSLGNIFSFIWRPFNFPESYKVTSSLICGLLSKESFLSSMVILYGSSENIISSFSKESLCALLVFVTLYMPCIAVFSVVRKEFNSFYKTIKVFLIETVVAYIISLLVYWILILI